MDFLKKLFGKTARPKGAITGELPDIDLPFDHILVSGEEALLKLEELRQNSYIVPVIMGDPKAIDFLVENIELSQESPEAIIEAAKAIPFPQWFESRAAEDKEYYEPPHGDWPEHTMPKAELISHLDILTRKALKETVIGLIPVTRSWEVPAYLHYGGWNECPYPQEHMALFKYWNETYGAKVASMTGDVIEFTVDNPPHTEEAAMALAMEQFVYCPDIVFQGVETVENLAASLMNSRVWYFWWD